MAQRIFVGRNISGVRAFGWQIDYRPDGWLPLGVREGWERWHVLRVGRCGVITAARMR